MTRRDVLCVLNCTVLDMACELKAVSCYALFLPCLSDLINRTTCPSSAVAFGKFVLYSQRAVSNAPPPSFTCLPYFYHTYWSTGTRYYYQAPKTRASIARELINLIDY